MSLKPRQAVVIIHGIGEQIPMATLNSFVEAVAQDVNRTSGQKAESKPDHLSPTLELRRIAVPGEKSPWTPGDWVSTDFYELYWAHLMTGTGWQHVMAWLATLLLRRPSLIPPRLRVAWWTCWILVLMAIAALTGPVGPKTVAEWSVFGTLAGILVTICRSTGTYFGLQYAGDAARYLNPRPENVGVRNAIRAAAIDLLEKLHDDPSWRRYHRIIVVGHSLGSVIAYDALSHLWQRRHHPKQTFPVPPESGVVTPTDHPERQAATWREQRAIGVQWKITDLVTLGSPLAYAQFLMASDETDFVKRKARREYPTCPPQPNDSRDQQYGDNLLATPTGGSLLHHAAPFACTRWTNFYFDKDIIGGEILGFGEWIDNKRLEPRGLFPHTRYWRSGADHTQLKLALDLKGWWMLEHNARVAVEAQKREDDAFRSSDEFAGPLTRMDGVF